MTREDFKSYKPAHSQNEVVKLLENTFGNKVKRIKQEDLGEINAVYFVTLESRLECVIRVSPKERGYNAFAQEAWAFQKCRKVGVPAPEVLAVDVSPSDFPEPYMIVKRIPGKPGSKVSLSEQDKQGVLKQLGHFLYLMHTIKVPGFGSLQQQGQEFVGKQNSLWEYLMYELELGWWLDNVLRENLLTSENIDQIRKRFTSNRELFGLELASLTHGDVSIKNLVIDKGKITGVTDMENVRASDPVQDFAWFHFFSEGKEPYFSSLKSGYDNKDLFDVSFMKKLCLYQLLLASSLLAYYHQRKNKDGLDFVYRRIPTIEKLFNSP